MNPADYKACPSEWFVAWNDWIPHDGSGQPVADDAWCKVRYADGTVSRFVRTGLAWRAWSGSINYWEDGRIVAYVVI